MTYMVLETHKSYCVVMDNTGRFLKVANMDFEVGQTIDEIFILKPFTKKNVSKLRIVGIVCASAACLLLIVAFYFNSILAPFASIYMSINPEIRMVVTKKGLVVALDPINDDGKALLDNYNGKRKDMSLVADELIDLAISNGFLSHGGTITVSIDSSDQMWFQETKTTFKNNLNTHLNEELFVIVEVQEYDYASKASNNMLDEPQSSAQSKEEFHESSHTDRATSAPDKQPEWSTENKTPEKTTYISGDDALNIALKHANVIRANVITEKVELDYDDNSAIYEVEFSTNDSEYDYNIDAITGDIIAFEADFGNNNYTNGHTNHNSYN